MASGSYMHRRPSYAERERMYPRRNRTGSTRNRTRTTSDYGIDNYAYNEAHLEKWTIPVNLLETLPTELKKAADEWQFAGAAVCSGLDRIKKLDDQSVYRGYPEPEMSTHPHLSRRVSNAQSSASMKIVGIDTPPMSSPDTSAPPSFTSVTSSMLPLEKMLACNGFPHRQAMGTESPPATPIDSSTCPTPENPRGIPIPTTTKPGPDVNALTRQLSPISMRGRNNSTASSQHSTASFDESAWDVYINAFKAEMDNLQIYTLQRVKGLSSKIERVCLEYGCDPKFKDAIREFAAWWDKNKGLVVKYEERVREIELPSIEYVRKERLANGWSI